MFKKIPRKRRTITVSILKLRSMVIDPRQVFADEIPLVHSVSFYRKKKKEMKSVGETTILGFVLQGYCLNSKYLVFFHRLL